MGRSAFNLVLHALGTLVLGLLVVVPVVVWRLSAGPIALDFLTPSIESALTAQDGSAWVKLDRTVLTLDESRRRLELRALGVKVYAGGTHPVLTVPQLALTVNGRALLSGELAANAVRAYGLKLRLVREADGHFALGLGDQGSASQAGGLVTRLLDGLMGSPDPGKPGRRLQRLAILGADLVVEDRARGTTWHAPDADFRFRRTPAGLEATTHLTLDMAGEAALVAGRLVYTRQGDGLAGELHLEGVRPAVLARFGVPLGGLAALDLPLSGVVRARGSLADGVESVDFDLSGDAGDVVLPAPVAMTRRIRSAVLRGTLDRGLTHARIDELSVDLGGPTLTVAAVADGLGGDTTINADVALREVPVDELATLWPAGVAPNPRAWTVNNLSRGMIREARVTLAARSPTGRVEDLEIGRAEGRIAMDGTTVNYLRPMPPVHDAAAVATFDTKAFRVDVKAGEVYGLRLTGGQILLSGLDMPDQAADIDLTIAGPVADALKLIDRPPLRYAAALGIKPEAVGGQAVTRLRLQFPLLAALKLSELAIKAHADLKGARVPGVLLGLDLTQGDLALDVDAHGMDVTGHMLLGTIPARLQWRENFASRGVPFRSRYVVQAPRVDEAQRRSLGLDTAPFVAPWLAGPVAANVTAVLQPGGKADIDARVDLTPARMAFSGLGWRKLDGTTGGAEVQLRVEHNRLAAVPYFRVAAGDLLARGAVAFGTNGKVHRVEFHKLSYARTDVAGSIGFRPGGGLDVTLNGPSFDARTQVSGDDGSDDGDGGEPLPQKKKKKEEDGPPPMAVEMTVRNLWLTDGGKLTGVSLAMRRDGADWRNATLNGTVGEGERFAATLQPAGPDRRSLRLTSGDAGAVLKAFDIYDDLVGGTLEVDATIDDTQDSQPLAGTIHIANYSVVNAPALARLLTVAALTGILDVLRGEGVAFTTLTAPFTLTDGLLQIDNARAYGPALGLTARGEFDLDRSRMALEGTVVPAYALNSVLGHIPVLGWLVTGGEKGGGLVAFNFSMRGPFSAPDVVVNPLSALTPGFLRHLFDVFDDGTGTEVRRRKPSDAVPTPSSPSPPPAAGP